MGLPNAQDARNAESVLTEQMQTAFAQACLDPSGRLPITIVGSGTRFGDAPKFQVLMDEVLVGQGDVAKAPDNTRQAVAYEQIDRASEVFQFEAMVSSVPATLAVQFMNDAWAGPDTTGDTDFWIKSVQVGDRVFPSEIFQFKSTEFMRGEWVGDWFRFATNGKLSIDLAGNLCG